MIEWCSTDIYITHPNENGELLQLEKLIRKWTNNNPVGEYFKESPLSDVVLNSGVGTVNTDKSTDLDCRGSIQSLETCEYKIHISTSTVSEPLLKMWQKIIDKYLPLAVMTYVAEEPGWGLFATNDPSYKNRYHIEIYGDQDFHYECAKGYLVVHLLQERLKSTKNKMSELMKELRAQDCDDIFVHKWRILPIDHWN